MMKNALVAALLATGFACTVNVDADLTYKQDTTPPQVGAQPEEGTFSATDVKSGKKTGDTKVRNTVIAGIGENTMYVANLSGESICWVYSDPCGASSDDLLGDDVLPYDWYLEATGIESGCQDMWAFDCTGESYWYGRFQMQTEFTWILLPGVSQVPYDTGFWGPDTGYDTWYDTAYDTWGDTWLHTGDTFDSGFWESAAFFDTY